ncbi:MAG: FixH family protein [Rickettsiales bacterium]
MSSLAENKKKVPFRDRIIPWYFVMGFAVLISVDSVMAYLAVHSYHGVVTENAYEKGLDYNADLAMEKEQEALGWKSGVAYENGALRVTIVDKNGAPLEKARVVAFIDRPLEDGYRKRILLKEKGRGVYAALVTFPLPGQWKVTAAAMKDGERFQSSSRIVMRASHK